MAGFREGLRRLHGRWTGSPVGYDLADCHAALARIDAVPVKDRSDPELKELALALKSRALTGESPDALLPEWYALVREASSRVLGLAPFDVQVMAGVALHRGALAQMQTGEGKTLAAVFPASLGALAGRGVHVFTANDYLARRDAEWMGPLYGFLGLEARAVAQGMTREERRAAYAADVTYVTAKEAGFDYLRDHTAERISDQVQRAFHFAIVDEADFILIDEARVPLVIAGPEPGMELDHLRMAGVARALEAGAHYKTDENARNVTLTEEGLQRAEVLLGSPALHAPENRLLFSAVNLALHAEVLLQRDRDYIVRGGRVELVDEFTGRVAQDRRWPHGIQPAVEAKEGVEVRPEGRILGSIPVHHFVRLYPKLAGMTATAVPAAQEFKAVYGMNTVVFPPHRPCIRADEADVVFSHREAKTRALSEEIRRANASGRPVLVGTASVGESESLAAALRSSGITCRVLNAKNDTREALVVAGAGRLGAVTISTNMAGRGVDILLGAGDEAEREKVASLGGLYVIGTNRHESRRVDMQLRGRAGRQGDPGSSRFFISLEDDLIARYGVMELIPRGRRPGRAESPVADPAVAREIARAQRIIEGQNYEIRRTLWLYTDMVELQRREVYGLRQSLLAGDGVPGFLASRTPEVHEGLGRRFGLAEVEAAERRLALHILDGLWSEHLALIEDIREGIHLQRYGGREPVEVFRENVDQAFTRMMASLEEKTAEALVALAEGGDLDLARAGLRGPSATWTYLVNDDPFSSFGISLLGSRNIGAAAWAGMLAVLLAPLSLPFAAFLAIRRFFKRR